MRVNTTIDDVNPAISYAPAANWAPGVHTDPSWTEYYLGTYMASTKLGDSASFSFTGTGVWLYGALRSNHGLYNVTIDGATTVRDGFGAGDGLYQQVLFGASGLTLGPHTITLTNNRNSSTYSNLDLDFIVFEEEIGDDTDTVGNQTDDDTSPLFTYGPAATAWSTVPANTLQYHSNTGHTTVTPGAYVTYTFNGSTVSIYGALGPSQGPYGVVVDGGVEASFTALNSVFSAQQVLYHGYFAGNTSHTIQLINRPAKTGQALDIDFAVADFAQAPIVATTSTSTTSTSTTATSSSSVDTSTDLPTVTPEPTEKKNSVSTGIIVAAVVGGLALLAMLSFALMMYRRRQQNKRDEDEPDMITVYPEPYAIGNGAGGNGGPGRYIPPSRYMSGYTELDSSGPTPLYPPSRGPFDQQSFPLQPAHVDGASLFSGYAPGVPGQANARPRLDSSSTGHGFTEVASTMPYGRDSAYTGVSDGSSRIPAHGHSAVGGPNYDAPLPPIPPIPSNVNRYSNPSPLALHQPPPPAPGLIPPQKGQRVSLPPTADPSQRTAFNNVSPDELSARRMNVDGREQDFGPLMVADADPLHAVHLPPNYAQATQPLQ